MAEHASSRGNSLIGVVGPRDDMPRVQISCRTFTNPEDVENAYDRLSRDLAGTGGQLLGFNVSALAGDSQGVNWAIVAQYVSRDRIRL